MSTYGPPRPDEVHFATHNAQSSSLSLTSSQYDGMLGPPSTDQRRSSSPGREPYAQEGPLINERWPREDTVKAAPDLTWSRLRRALREPFAEFMGVFVFVMFGNGSIAQVVLSGGAKGDYQSIAWGWGLGIMLGVYTAGLSGAHLNPAVTLANCVFRRFPWRKLLPYAIAQTLGAFAASGVVYANYVGAINAFEGSTSSRTVPGYSDHATAGIFSTYPAPFMTRTGEFFSEFVASALLMFCIYALKDDANLGAGPLTPLGLFFVIFGIGSCFGWETGFAINLARDFGPRCMAAAVGYGREVFSAGGYYFWIPMVAPFLGCLFGGWLYDVLLFTGDSPINTPWMGLKRLVSKDTRTAWDRRHSDADAAKDV